MKKVLNVLFSTTRQWNPGDEFILLGTINLLSKSLGVEINPIIYNRNPHIRRANFKESLNKTLEKLTNGHIGYFFDNSMKKDLDASFIDLAVFAGSPEWYGRRLKDFYTICLENNIPTIFMGIGLGEKKLLADLKDYEKKLLKKSIFITTRDENTQHFLREFRARYIPCPALFSSKSERKVGSVKKIGLIYNSDKVVANNGVSTVAHKYTMELYKNLINKYGDTYKFEFISHYIEELPEFYKMFPNDILRYSYDSKDYLKIYDQYDLVIGARVHGIGIAASLGIPGIMIAHDIRANVVKGFLGDIFEITTPINDILECVGDKIKGIDDTSNRIIKHKMATEEQYVEVIDTLKRCI